MAALALLTITSLFLAVAVAWFAARRADYSHVRHTISELGESGARSERAVSYGVFLPVGCMLLMIALLLKESSPVGAILALCIGIGYVTSALFPCDPGSPVFGSLSQMIHNYIGGIEYVGGSIALWHLGGSESSAYFRATSIYVGVATVALVMPRLWRVRGLVQRVAEIGLFVALAASID